ncbi:FAD-dependent oxidoreductase [Nocardiopsis suaedae]|uniref:FAD-dependent oxidoreductase n=1 Tax=Nocardiopsis suaedae TaxID=3018444 RepID=A0ABT4TW19_9ACTN|nr:FAD-dependent oxidoreductase [Nocardiopsis suaedae]MDA2808444.1 FAD-dependent oxidoreductase [Nocardiopsis suaedae]
MTGRRTGAGPVPDTWIVFDGEEVPAVAGEPVSASLLAAGVRTVCLGIRTGRPRGVVGIGTGEPGAQVRTGGPDPRPMAPATRVEAREGLRVSGLAGYGRLPEQAPARRGDARWAHCDVLVVGAGPAGLAAADAARAEGARVIIADEAPEPGGGARGNGRDAWAAATWQALAEAPDVRALARTTVTGHYDHGEHAALERRGRSDLLWRIRARRTVLATGSTERPFAFQDDDLPGVMLAEAAAAYVRRHGVLPGERAVVAGCHDGALWAAAALHDGGARIEAAADARPRVGAAAREALRRRGIEVRPGTSVVRAEAGADGGVAAALLVPVGTARGEPDRVPCDLLAVSGGHDPAAPLAVQAGARLHWSAAHAAFLPGGLPPTTVCVGAAAGTRDPEAAVEEGIAAGAAAARAALGPPAVPPDPVHTAPQGPLAGAPGGGLPDVMRSRGASAQGHGGEGNGGGESAPLDLWSGPDEPTGPAATATEDVAPPMALFSVTGPGTDAGRVYVDLQRDAALSDIRAAVDAGMDSIELIKRHTTIGTGPDQGRTCATVASGITAHLLGRTMDEVGGTTPRPPYAPVPFTALAGRARGELIDPLRRTPMQSWHEAHGAVYEDVGQWRRARYYPQGDEDMHAAVLRECAAARTGIAALDASTLGKIIVAGRDAGVFLDRLYTGNLSTLKPGRCRYGLLCTADGMVLDDGVIARLPDGAYLVSTTSGNAETVLDHMEEWSQTEWPELCVHVFNATDAWAVVSLVGPRSRDVMRRLAPGMDVSQEAFRFMDLREGEVAGVRARVLRVSFTGELTFEVNVPSWYGLAVWEAAMDAGADLGITPYGTETMHVLRAEKGFIVVGHETDGSVTPLDLGMDWALSRTKDFVGKRSLSRPDTARGDRPQLVGLLPEDPGTVLAEGAQLIGEAPGTGPPRARSQGWVTSSYDSAALGRSFALGLLRSGRARHGEVVHAVHLDTAVPVRVADPVFYDREGSRKDG